MQKAQKTTVFPEIATTMAIAMVKIADHLIRMATETGISMAEEMKTAVAGMQTIIIEAAMAIGTETTADHLTRMATETGILTAVIRIITTVAVTETAIPAEMEKTVDLTIAAATMPEEMAITTDAAQITDAPEEKLPPCLAETLQLMQKKQETETATAMILTASTVVKTTETMNPETPEAERTIAEIITITATIISITILCQENRKTRQNSL